MKEGREFIEFRIADIAVKVISLCVHISGNCEQQERVL